MVIAGMIPLEVLATEAKEIYEAKSEDLDRRSLLELKSEARRASIDRWQHDWEQASTWTMDGAANPKARAVDKQEARGGKLPFISDTERSWLFQTVSA